MNLEFESFNNSFSGNINYLKDECKNAFKIKEIKSQEQYSQGTTYFVRANECPTKLYLLERLAMEIFQYHTQNIHYAASNSGAEWWVQYIDFEDEIGFHFDKDYGLEEENNIHKYPNLATVSYLSSIGASTVIIDKKGPININNPNNKRKKENNADILGIASYIISKPVEGKHIKFDGRLLHGAPTNLDDDTDCSSDQNSGDDSSNSSDINENESKRITFLVNIWIDHIPVQAAKFSYGHDYTATANSNHTRFCPTAKNQKIYKLHDNGGCELHNHEFRFDNDLLEICYTVPKGNDLIVIEKDFDIIHVPTNAYCCVKKIGEFHEESPDEDEETRGTERRSSKKTKTT